MSTRSALVAFFTLAIGGFFLFVGLAGISFYVSYAVESTGEGSRSGLFWYLPILFLGVGGVVAGILLLVVGICAGRGSVVCVRIGYGVLVVVPLIALALLGLSHVSERSAQREREARKARSAEIERILAEMHQIHRLTVREQPDGAVALNITTTGGLAGFYELRLKVDTSRGTLYRQASRMRFESSVANIQRSVTYDALFARCFDDADSNEFFVCVQGAGTANIRFELEAELRLLRAAGNTRMDIQNGPEMFNNSASVNFFMDTFTRSGQVEIEAFRLDDE